MIMCKDQTVRVNGHLASRNPALPLRSVSFLQGVARARGARSGTRECVIQTSWDLTSAQSRWAGASNY